MYFLVLICRFRCAAVRPNIRYCKHGPIIIEFQIVRLPSVFAPLNSVRADGPQSTFFSGQLFIISNVVLLFVNSSEHSSLRPWSVQVESTDREWLTPSNKAQLDNDDYVVLFIAHVRLNVSTPRSEDSIFLMSDDIGTSWPRTTLWI